MEENHHSSQADLKNPKDLSIEIGTKIWIPDAERVWRTVKIVQVGPNRANVTVNGKYGVEKMALSEIGGFFRVNPRAVEDMTSLYYIHEAGILENLRLRAQPGSLYPYTSMANVLVAVNPLVKTVEPKLENYIGASTMDRCPHPYSIAEMAFQQMIVSKSAKSQSIIISGESGAGKTETSKIVLRFLTSRQHVRNESSKIDMDLGTDIDKQLWDTNPILEAFGNAKTLRNHNSSRFGKFMKMQFDESHAISRAYIETYLLEKFRVVDQIKGERNFHIFYFLLAGADEKMREELQLLPVTDFMYLNRSGCTKDPSIDDELLFDEVISALATVGIDEPMQKEIWKILAGLLHLGNIELIDAETAEGDAAQIANLHVLQRFSELLGMKDQQVSQLMTEREISTRGETFIIKRLAKEGRYIRDAIAKSVYNQLFLWIVHQMNASIEHGASNQSFIGVLDIFGFESFDTNDFEQLLINYANEALQATFNQHVLAAEQELFLSEGIKIGNINWPDNRDCINLIAQKPNGILPLLDHEAKTPKPSDEKWNATLHKLHNGHSHFQSPHEKDKKYIFIIKHFAVQVPYTIGNFINKNMDTVPQELEALVSSSSSLLLPQLFGSKLSVEITDKVFDSRNLARSVSANFSDQMQQLIRTLNTTQCNFIRCIKPNPTMSPEVFDPKCVVDQLRCTGMLATCELLKVGLPTRVSYSEICRYYKPALPPSVVPLFQIYDDRVFTEAVLWSFRVDADAYRLGRTKVFFKSGKIGMLDALLQVDMEKMGSWIVSRLRKWLARRRWRYALAKVHGQNGFLWLYQYVKLRSAMAMKIQGLVRQFQARKRYIPQRDAFRVAQTCKAIARQRLRLAFSSVIAFNRFKRIFEIVRARTEERISASIKIQARVRGNIGRDMAKLRKNCQAAQSSNTTEQGTESNARALIVMRWHVAFHVVVAQRRLMLRNAKALGTHDQTIANINQEQEKYELATTVSFELHRFRQKTAAQRIQRAIRRHMTQSDRDDLYRKVEVTSRAAAEAENEAVLANAALPQACQEEVYTRNRLSPSDSAGRLSNIGPVPTGCLGEVGMVGALGTVDGVQGMLTAGEDIAISPSFPGSSEALGIAHVPGFATQQRTLQNADLSWIPQEARRIEGEGVAGNANRIEQLAQAGRDLFGEGGEAPSGALMAAEDENIINPVQKVQDFSIGPPIPYKGGIFTCTMVGHRKQQDQNWGDEYSEYVLRCTWGRDILEQSKTAWLVGGRYNDFNVLHQELKAAASGRRGKRAPWFPRFPKRHPFSSIVGKNQREQFIIKREKELNRYMTQVLTQMPDALLNIHLDRFFNLTLRTQDICEREAFAEARKRWEEEERQALANASEAEPLTDTELHEVEQLVDQLLQNLLYAAGDMRQNTQLQEMIHAVKVLHPRVAASAQIGAGVSMELVPLAMQLQDDIQEAFNQYNDTLLALRLRHDLN